MLIGLYLSDNNFLSHTLTRNRLSHLSPNPNTYSGSKNSFRCDKFTMTILSLQLAYKMSRNKNDYSPLHFSISLAALRTNYSKPANVVDISSLQTQRPL